MIFQKKGNMNESCWYHSVKHFSFNFYQICFCLKDLSEIFKDLKHRSWLQKSQKNSSNTYKDLRIG